MISSIAELRTRLTDVRSAARKTGELSTDASAEPTVALISTIGALHDGHLDLIQLAKERADILVVSIFVNPLRFATTAAFEAYPRTPDEDAALLASLGVDVVFAPTVPELLPQGSQTTKISAGDLGLRFEGRARPGYFDGLLTIEAKLMNLVRPDFAVYGRRDAQRIFLVFRLAEDEFALPIETVVEVAQMPEQITRVPRTPKFLEGVMNLRGEVLPILDQRRRFDMPPLPDSALRRLVVVKTERHRAGLIVDSVSEVLRVDAAQIEPPPQLTEANSRLVHGVINLPQAQRLVLLLDPAELLTRAEQGLLDTFQAARKKADA